MSNMTSQPTAVWVLSDTGAVAGALQAAGNGQFPVFVAYNIPGRDCGNHSAGGTSDGNTYRGWVEAFAGAIGSGNAVVIIEPDALSLDCMPEAPELIGFAVTRFKKNPNTFVYIDAGHAQFPELSAIIDRLSRANIQAADGFALNVSNFYSDSELIQRAEQINTGLEPQIGRKAHFVIDTSRNGNGSNGEWCNPSGRALGRRPTTQTGVPLMDAALWIKTPGESDGSCNGGPPAGQWFDRMANELNGAPPKDGPGPAPAVTPNSTPTPGSAAPQPGTAGSAGGSGDGSGGGGGGTGGGGSPGWVDCKTVNRDGVTCQDIGIGAGQTTCKWDQTWECQSGCAKYIKSGC
jgi:endoglucanase